MSYTAKEGKQSLKVFNTWPHTSFWLRAVCNRPHLQGTDPPSRALSLRMALQTRTFHRKKKKKNPKKELNKQENKSYQLPKQGKTLPGKLEICSASCVPTGITALLPCQKKPFFPENPQRCWWMKGSLYQEAVAVSTHNLIIKKKPHAGLGLVDLVFFFFLRLQVKLSSAELLLCLHYSNSWNTVSLIKTKLT